MLENIHIAVIGAGAMGGALIGGLLRQQLVGPQQIVAAEPRPARQRELHEQYGIQVTADNAEAVRQGQLVVLAVKPQTIPTVLPPLRGLFQADALCLSILAGIPLRTFAEKLEHSTVVRAMPNTPAQIGAGMTVWTALPEVTEIQQGWARATLGALGRQQYVENEGYLDMATAISGSGPAYVFLIIEAMIDAGVQLGLPRPAVQEMVLQTILGATQYVQESGQHPAVLRNAVTSPAGTTAAGLSELERGALRAVLGDAIRAAHRRAIELGQMQ